MTGAVPARPRPSRRAHLGTVAFGAWLILGLFVDGWAHNNGKPESFFTPWHGVFYSGFAATATWMGWQATRGRAVPAGYGLGIAGVAVFALGGIGDLIWHQIFGIEVDLEALFSPSHLVLFAGALLILTSPLRAEWGDPTMAAPSLRRFLPALLSATLATATVAFFLMPYSPFLSGAGSGDVYRFLAEESGFGSEASHWLAEQIRLVGLASVLLTTVVLIGPALLLVRRWVTPFGSLTVLSGAVGLLMSGVDGFRFWPTVVAAAVAGLAGDVLVARLRPSVDRPGPFRALGAIVPAVLWLTYFASLAVVDEVGWSVELWGGVSVMAALAGFALALAMVPPTVPRPVGDAAPGGEPVRPSVTAEG